ncbi:MAG: sensor histidine kinase, partial [Ferrovibrio sp.]
QASHAALRQAQQQLIRSERLATIGQLSAGLAHEINNPIAVIQGNLDLVRETLGPAATPVQAELALIDAQVERIRLIVTRLLQHARPTEFAGYVEPLALPAVLDDCVVLVERLLQQRGIRLRRDDRATTAAYIAYSRAGERALEAESLGVLGNAFAARKQWRNALDTLRLSLDLRETA